MYGENLKLIVFGYSVISLVLKTLKRKRNVKKETENRK